MRDRKHIGMSCRVCGGQPHKRLSNGYWQVSHHGLYAGGMSEASAVAAWDAACAREPSRPLDPLCLPEVC